MISVGTVLSKKSAVAVDDGEEWEEELLKSELWTTLFRGGYMVRKLQRSLSGKYVSYCKFSVIWGTF